MEGWKDGRVEGTICILLCLVLLSLNKTERLYNLVVNQTLKHCRSTCTHAEICSPHLSFYSFFGGVTLYSVGLPNKNANVSTPTLMLMSVFQ